MSTIAVSADYAGARLDKFLRKQLPLIPLGQIFRLIRTGGVCIDGRKVKQDYRLAEGETVTIAVDESELRQPDLEGDALLGRLAHTAFFKRNFHILFEDDSLLVLNKPSGLVVHPGTGHRAHDTLVELAEGYCISKGSTEKPVLAHRIDRDTSGVIIMAKNLVALRSLTESFRDRLVEKEYVALVHGRPKKLKGTIDAPIAKTFGRNDGTKMMVDDDRSDAQNAVTHYEVLHSDGRISKLQVRIDTGRTHQIRVHLHHIGCPIIGDERYGDPARDASLFEKGPFVKRLYLHSFRLTIPHPVSCTKMVWCAPEPVEFKGRL